MSHRKDRQVECYTSGAIRCNIKMDIIYDVHVVQIILHESNLCNH